MDLALFPLKVFLQTILHLAFYQRGWSGNGFYPLKVSECTEMNINKVHECYESLLKLYDKIRSYPLNMEPIALQLRKDYTIKDHLTYVMEKEYRYRGASKGLIEFAIHNWNKYFSETLVDFSPRELDALF